MLRTLLGPGRPWSLMVALLSPALALAEAPAVPGTPAPVAAAPRLTGEGEVAYLKSSGSSSQQTFKGFTATRYQRDAWAHELRLEGLNESNSQSGLRTRERYFGMEKTSWNFTPRDYLFVKPQYEKDLQTAYEYQAQLALGYGHQFLKTDTALLSVDLGAGYRHDKANVSGDSTDEGVGNVALKYEWKFRPGARLTEDAAADIGSDSTVVRTRSAVIFQLRNTLGMVVAYETRHDDGPVALNDRLTTVGLNYTLK